jgi:hypothetical protein
VVDNSPVAELELLIVLAAAGLELPIVLVAAEVVRPIVPAETIALEVAELVVLAAAEVVRPIVPAAETIALEVAEPVALAAAVAASASAIDKFPGVPVAEVTTPSAAAVAG